MAFKPDQPRIPKGMPGAGRFVKVGTALAALTPNGTARRDRGPSLSRIAQALTGTAKGARTRAVGSKPTAANADVRASVAKHAAGKRSGWVDLADVRDDLAAKGYTRQQQDDALKAMLRDPDVRIVNVADQGKLSQRDRDAALEMHSGAGGRMHAIQIGGEPEVRTKPGPAASISDLRSDLEHMERMQRFEREEGMSEDSLAARAKAIADLRQRIGAADAPRPKAPPKAKTESFAAVGAKLRTAGSRKEAHALLTDLTGAQLRQLARDQNVPLYAGTTKAKIRTALVEVLAGGRLDTDAITRGSWRR